MPVLATVLAQPTCNSPQASADIAVLSPSTSEIYIGQEVKLDFLEPHPLPAEGDAGSQHDDQGPAPQAMQI